MLFGFRPVLASLLVSIAASSLAACAYIHPDNNPNIDHHCGCR